MVFLGGLRRAAWALVRRHAARLPRAQGTAPRVGQVVYRGNDCAAARALGAHRSRRDAARALCYGTPVPPRATALFADQRQIMAVVATRDVLRGQTTLDTVRLRRPTKSRQTGRFVCIPPSVEVMSGRASGVDHRSTDALTKSDTPLPIFAVLPGERVYDLGWRENLRRAMSAPLFGGRETRYVFCCLLTHGDEL